MLFKLICFDLDDCLIHEGFEDPILCDETMAVLDYIKGKVKIVLATHNYAGQGILDRLGIADRFDLVLSYYDYTNKVSHLWRALQTFDIKPAEALFYDDVSENINAVRMHGAGGVLVDHRKGITLEQVKSKFEMN